MARQELLLSGAVLLLFSINGGMGPVGARADAMVTGSVFCDQCKDGELSLFDYPLYGALVGVACPGADGSTTAYKEESTNWMGGYAIRFYGSPDLRRCSARVVRGPPSGCGAAAGPARGLSLMFSMFGMEMYMVDPLLSQPQQPMALCPRASGTPTPAAGPVLPPPSSTPTSPLPPVLPPPPPPAVGFRPPVNPLPSVEASACSFDKWMMPEYKCYWRVVGPDTKVAVAFGPVAAGRYGTDATLWEGLHGRGDVYRTLLREATAALLNSYNSLGFSYPTLSVMEHTNWALLGSPQQALATALRFKRANAGVSGSSAVPCTFSTCS
ncbi:protodermal factor 1 [Iris pallida]|uniref:Protodermal factor 1 n=1 Tax=Iris pallida TaxID=29817 RepID=A0AAX6IBP5_IRIPA|nr:protodermal factor 1 [Iris pallida]